MLAIKMKNPVNFGVAVPFPPKPEDLLQNAELFSLAHFPFYEHQENNSHQ